VVEEGDLAVIAEIGRLGRLQRHHRHEAHDLAAGLADRITEAAAAQEAAQPVEEDADLHAFPGALGEQLHEALAHGVAAQDEGHDVDAVLRRADAVLEPLEGVLARGEEGDGVAAHGRAGAIEAEHARHEGLGRRAVARRGQDRVERGLARDKFPELPAAEHQVERHADVGDEGDGEQPGEGVARLLAVAHEPGDGKKRQEKTRDRQQMRQHTVGERVLEEGVVISFQRLHRSGQYRHHRPVGKRPVRLGGQTVPVLRARDMDRREAGRSGPRGTRMAVGIPRGSSG
jgi:hypothetical protein